MMARWEVEAALRGLVEIETWNHVLRMRCGYEERQLTVKM